MPFETVVLQPGVKVEQTSTLLKANIVRSNLIRFRGGMAEKLGGWVNITPQYYEYGLPGIGRELCAFADLNNLNHLILAGGTQPDGGFIYEARGAPQKSLPTPITPQYFTSPIGIDLNAPSTITTAATFSSVSGSPIITVSDPNPFGLTAGVIPGLTVIQIINHVSVGGVILFGTYIVATGISNAGPPSTALSYTFTAQANALHTGTSPALAAVAQFSAISGSNVITVHLVNHGLVPGSPFQVSMPTRIFTTPGITQIVIGGFYNVTSVIDANTFTITAEYAAQGTAGPNNEGNEAGAPVIIYWNPLTIGLTSPLSASFPSPAGQNPPIYLNVSSEDWSLGNYGGRLAASPMNGPLFFWNPLNASAGPASITYAHPVPAAPSIMTGFFIAMPQQMIVAYGAAIAQGPLVPAGQVQDPMQVAWCDAGNPAVWTAAANNQAGTFRLTRGSKIIGGIQGPQQGMLFTDVGVWIMAYVGYPDVWGFNEIAQGAVLVAKDGVGVYGAIVYWMSLDGFWMYAQGSVQRVPCDVWDVIFQNLNKTKDNNGNYLFLHHIRMAVNTGMDEIAWHFPSTVTSVEQTAANAANPGASLIELSSVAGIEYGMLVADLTNPTALNGGPLVTAINSSPPSVVLSQEVNPSGPGVFAGDVLVFGNGENDSFVKMNTVSGEWDYTLSVPQPALASPLPISVTAWLDENIYGHPISSMQNFVWLELPPNQLQPFSMIVQHEESPDAVGETLGGVWEPAAITWMIQTGFFQLAEAEEFVFVDYVLPDFKWRTFPQPQTTSATVHFTLHAADFPDDPNHPAVAYGPYTVTNAGLPGQPGPVVGGQPTPPVPNAGFEPRCRGRYFFAVIWGDDLGSFVRMGGIKFRFQPDGRNP